MNNLQSLQHFTPTGTSEGEKHILDQVFVEQENFDKLIIPKPGSGEGFAWKIGVAVGVGVLAALLIFNAYERHQTRRDVEEAVRALEQENAKLEREMQAAVRSVAVPPPRSVPVIHPVPPGYRCAGGTLLYRDGNSWTQITARSNHVYCPGTKVKDCYPVTPASVGCSA